VPGLEIVTAAPTDRDAVAALEQRVRDATGHPALGDAVRRDLADPGPDSVGFVARGEEPDAPAIAFLHVGRSDTFAPRHWVLGLVLDRAAADDAVTSALLAAAVDHIATHGGGDVTIWIFDPTAADDARARSCGFTRQRDLYQMRVPLPIDETPKYPDGVTVRTFEPGRDEAAWLEVNNRAFGNHPDQGGWIAETLERRMAEPWFDPSLFILAFDADGLAGSNWLKVHEADGGDPRMGEIFVIGVDPNRQGQGYGRALALDGLARVAARGITTGMLYVDAANTGALALYRALGFTVHRTDRAFGRIVDAR
jgi:mycothiol synthase